MKREDLPGFKMVEGRSNRKWVDNKVLVEKTLKELGVEKTYKDPVFVGFGEVEKQIGKNKINAITVKPPGKPTLVVEEDKRPAIIFYKGADLLGSLEEDDSDIDETF